MEGASVSIIDIDFYAERDGEEELLRVTVDYRPGRPAYITGPPESCYPEESDEFDVLEIRTNRHGRDEWVVVDEKLSADELRQLEELAADHYDERRGGYEP